MKITLPGFRVSFLGGLIVAIAIGVYLLQLWQPDRQVELHSAHLLQAIEEKDWSRIGEFIDTRYQDQWGHDRTVVLARLREILRYTRNLRLEPHDAIAFGSGESGEWRARVTATGQDNELMALIRERINTLPQPFQLRWQRQSWKPWDWKLVRVTNPALELPEGAGF